MGRRWGLLLPWYEAVKTLIKYKHMERDWATWATWADQKYFLEVKLPMRCGMTEDENGDEYEYGMKCILHNLKLLLIIQIFPNLFLI